jgi:LPS-assembly protein
MNDNDGINENDTEDALQRIPEISLDIYKHQLLDTAFEWEARNQLNYFWREEGDTGYRADFHPQLSLPLRSGFGTLIPKVGYRQTIYYTDYFDDRRNRTDRLQTRGIFDFETTAFTEVYRIFDLTSPEAIPLTRETIGQSRWTRLKHTVKPELEYSYIPDQNQDDLPSYDSLDEIEPENELTYSITTSLTRRRDTVVNATAHNATSADLKTDYREIVRIKAEQSYDFEEANRRERVDTYPSRPFSDVRVEVDISPASWLSLSQTTWISPYLGTVTEHEHMLRLSWQDRFSAYFGLDFLKDLDDDYKREDQEELQIIKVGGSARLSKKWNVWADYEYDQAESELIRQAVGFGYTHQCWGVNLSYEKTDDEDKVLILINLHQFGAFEQSFSPPGVSDD